MPYLSWWVFQFCYNDHARDLEEGSVSTSTHQDWFQCKLTQNSRRMATIKHGLQVLRSRLKNGVLVAQTWNITYEKVAAFGLVEWYDDLFMEVL